MTAPHDRVHPLPTSVAALLVTDDTGAVLLVRAPTPPCHWSLPGGPVTQARPPRETSAREAVGTIGLAPRLGGLLALDWPAAPGGPDAGGAHGDGTPGGAGLPLQVFDGGGISRSARRRVVMAAPVLADGGAVTFVPPERLADHLHARSLRVVEAALRARENGQPAYLENGHVPAALEVMRRYGISPWVHSGSAWSWHEEPVPDRLPIRQSWVWLFAPDGRVVMYVDDAGQVGLPGGTLERYEARDAAATALREVREETQIDVADLRYLGYVRDAPPGKDAVARVRMAGAIAAVGPAATDPATGTVHRRLLAPAWLAAELCGWGPSAAPQVAAALRAARSLGIGDPDPRAEVEEIPPDGRGVLTAASSR